MMSVVTVDIQIVINGKMRAEAINLNLVNAQRGIDEVKKAVLEECRLSSGEYDKYMLSYLYAMYANEDEEVKQMYMPIVSKEEMQRYILQTVKSGSKIKLRIEKNTNIDSVLADSENPGTTSLKRRRMLLSSKTQKKAKNEIQFNSSGQVVRDMLQVLQERPYYSIYPIMSEFEACAFCRGSSQDEDLRVKAGPVYGPIKLKMAGSSGDAYVHELCALWTPEIFLDEKNKFRNLAKGIRRCNKIKCTQCKQKGGGLGCFIKDCDKSYHYMCAKETNCLFVNSKFIIYCGLHRDEAPPEYLEEEKIEEEVTEGLMHYICAICKSGLDEDHIVICEGCDRGFHSNCHQPVINIEEIEEDKAWYCKACSLEEEL